jgi:hypothetical protein
MTAQITYRSTTFSLITLDRGFFYHLLEQFIYCLGRWRLILILTSVVAPRIQTSRQFEKEKKCFQNVKKKGTRELKLNCRRRQL